MIVNCCVTKHAAVTLADVFAHKTEIQAAKMFSTFEIAIVLIISGWRKYPLQNSSSVAFLVGRVSPIFGTFGQGLNEIVLN